ncbi:MAG: PAS domain-containing protein [Clostridia bacterium]|nr:PAS domain-containing protein [Clostridia bacterium]
MLHQMFKSIIEQDTAPIVVCDMQSVIVYMNPAAIRQYHRDLTGQSLKDCHNQESNRKIDQVLDWFLKSGENNLVFTYHDPKKNKDVYMVALRDHEGNLIGYYEKHECRNHETMPQYHLK